MVVAIVVGRVPFGLLAFGSLALGLSSLSLVFDQLSEVDPAVAGLRLHAPHVLRGGLPLGESSSV